MLDQMDSGVRKGLWKGMMNGLGVVIAVEVMGGSELGLPGGVEAGWGRIAQGVVGLQISIRTMLVMVIQEVIYAMPPWLKRGRWRI
ncbi:hypothetical protein GUJ93_ZPchr0007g5055 [Zizania palustris]|uniref:Uncharacterized protein n=1 Tax=Zizania palustris TaxID=103762 RepID=A0A8J5VS37_ZIZPA|nr:hypothetical protein GUJ93_ZPchr0007g5055 [Zizania palustris]